MCSNLFSIECSCGFCHRREEVLLESWCNTNDFRRIVSFVGCSIISVPNAIYLMGEIWMMFMYHKASGYKQDIPCWDRCIMSRGT